MQETTRTYLPAAGHDWLLPLYDPFVRLLGGDAARRALLDLADIWPGQRVLDIGCGTGSLVVLLKRLHPGVEVIGLDPDPKALARVRRKAERSAVSVRLDQGFSDQLPYPDATLDRVVSSFMFHHLEEGEKKAMLREARRVLKPGGLFCLLDFAGSEAGEAGFMARLFHSSHRLKDNSDADILALLRAAGFAAPEKVARGALFFGLLRANYFKAAVPA